MQRTQQTLNARIYVASSAVLVVASLTTAARVAYYSCVTFVKSTHRSWVACIALDRGWKQTTGFIFNQRSRYMPDPVTTKVWMGDCLSMASQALLSTQPVIPLD